MKNIQSAYHVPRVEATDDVDRDVFEAMKTYLMSDLGIDEIRAEQRARIEIERRIPRRVLDNLERHDKPIRGARVLDLGAGLGGLSEELVRRGAHTVALEPGAAWASVTRRRLQRCGKNWEVLQSPGESIPLAANSVDGIISLQVLEHVREPASVLSEAYRVLRPGGYFFLACENYLAFWEPHYSVPWLPLLPKPLGARYLRLLGRSPAFLLEAITYTTYPSVLRDCRRIGFVRTRDVELLDNVNRKPGLKMTLLRWLSSVAGDRALQRLDLLQHVFAVGIYELLTKPPSSNPAMPEKSLNPS